MDNGGIIMARGDTTIYSDGTGVAASGLTGTTMAENVVTSSLTTIGTLGDLTVTNDIVGSITGNAATADDADDATEWDGAAKTVSVDAPSDGADGDVWFVYTA